MEGWFDGKTPKPWHEQVAPTYLEAGKNIGPLMSGAEWMHDGVAIYYSHPSIQLGWILDAEAHGKTWVNGNNDEKLSSSCHVRHAWENMLRDAGLQYSYVSYVDVIQKGIPPEYKVLILPACLCLSDAEARQSRPSASAAARSSPTICQACGISMAKAAQGAVCWMRCSASLTAPSCEPAMSLAKSCGSR